MFILFLLIINSPAIISQLTFVQNHSVTLRISPVEEEFFLNVDFYGSEQDAVEQENNLFGAGFRIEPSNQEQNRGFLSYISWDVLNMWVRIYFDDSSESPSKIHHIGIGQMVTSTLLGIEISILIEPNLWQTDEWRKIGAEGEIWTRELLRDRLFVVEYHKI